MDSAAVVVNEEDKKVMSMLGEAWSKAEELKKEKD
jgi:hypothetical protein